MEKQILLENLKTILAHLDTIIRAGKWDGISDVRDNLQYIIAEIEREIAKDN